MGTAQSSSIQVKSKPKDRQDKWVYHYTDMTGYHAILNSSRIRVSVANGPKKLSMGNGVYFTRLDPSNGMKTIHANNYTTAGGPIPPLEKTAYFFQVPINTLMNQMRCTTFANTRDICVVPNNGEDLILPPGTRYGKTNNWQVKGQVF